MENNVKAIDLLFQADTKPTSPAAFAATARSAIAHVCGTHNVKIIAVRPSEPLPDDEAGSERFSIFFSRNDLLN